MTVVSYSSLCMYRSFNRDVAAALSHMRPLLEVLGVLTLMHQTNAFNKSVAAIELTNQITTQEKRRFEVTY